MAFEIFRSIVELVAGFGGLYALYQCMKHLRSVLRASSPEEAWKRFTALMAWGVGSCAALMVCTLAGARSMGVLVLAILMSLSIVGSGFVLAVLRVKALKGGGGSSPSELGDGETVIVRSLVHGRVRGRDESGGEVRFSTEELRSLVGSRGHVRMLNWTSARKTDDRNSGIAPLMAFWSEAGDAFVLYPDDEVVLATGVH